MSNEEKKEQTLTSGIVYIPYWEHQWHVLAFNTIDARYRKYRGYDAIIRYQGMDYNGEGLHSTEAGAWAYVYRDYSKARQDEINASAYVWKQYSVIE